jgi:hypothetical protein
MPMKMFELTIAVRNVSPDKWTPRSIHRIEADDMIELCAQLQLLLVTIQRDLHEEEVEALRRESIPDDDIPF